MTPIKTIHEVPVGFIVRGLKRPVIPSIVSGFNTQSKIKSLREAT